MLAAYQRMSLQGKLLFLFKMLVWACNAFFERLKAQHAFHLTIPLLECRWAMMMPPSIQVCPIEIPGRGRREQDSPISNVADLAQALARGLPLQASFRQYYYGLNSSAHSEVLFVLALFNSLRIIYMIGTSKTVI